MKKTNNTIAIQFEELMWQCNDAIAEIETTLKEFKYSQKEIKGFIEDSGLNSLKKDYKRDYVAANEMSEDTVHDTFTLGYMEEAKSALEHIKERANESLASMQEKQRQ